MLAATAHSTTIPQYDTSADVTERRTVEKLHMQATNIYATLPPSMQNVGQEA